MQYKDSKPVIVLSAVNLIEGGPLSILEDAVHAFVNSFINSYRLIVLVNDRRLLIKYADKIELLQFSYPKKSWFFRLWFEYVHCLSISKKINADVWISLHDMTPNVCCRYQIVYCHNAAAFYRPALKEIWHEKKLLFFCTFYGLFYKINLKRNDAVVVQQQWMRSQFIKRYKVKEVIVAHPQVHCPMITSKAALKNCKYKFFYPSYPRAFKNFEVLLKAASQLFTKRYDFEVLITLRGNENSYSKSLLKKYGNINCIKFLGIQKREDVWRLYNETDCLVFASKLETWGLPITEMKFFNKPIIAARACYTAESLGDYHKFCCFNSNDPQELGRLMTNAIDNKLVYDQVESTVSSEPFTQNWEQLYSYLFQHFLKQGNTSIKLVS